MYGVLEDRRDELLAILKRAREEIWLQPALPDPYATYIGFEQEAKRIRNYESLFIPGLLQTEAYAGTAIPAGEPGLSPQEIQSRVSARMARQVQLDSGLDIDVVIDEAALRRQVGGPEVMQEQLKRLLDDSDNDRVTLQVIPFDAGAHPGMHGSFVILQFSGDEQRDVVYIEASTTDLFLDSTRDVTRYNSIFDQLRPIALDPTQSRDLMARILTEVE